MGKLSVVLGLTLVLCFIASTAFPLSYEIDIGGDGSFETGGIFNVFPQSTLTVDVYLNGYACPPDDLLFGVDAYIASDESKADITSCYPSYPPFDPTLSGCWEQETDVYRLVASNFSFVQVSNGQQKFGTLEIEFLQDDEYVDLVVAAELTPYGYLWYNESIVVDCNMEVYENTADDAVVTMIRSSTPLCLCDFNGDVRVGLADLVIMKQEFLRADCDANPCLADCNGDGQVNLTDLMMLKNEFTQRCLETP